MGKAGRFACIFVPMALTIASLICLILVELGNQNTSDTASGLYFLRISTDKFKDNPDVIQGTDLDSAMVNMEVHTKTLKDFYQIGLWNYCSGDIDSDGNYEVTFCSPHERSYYFDPEKVWGLRSANGDDVYGGKLDDAMKVYKKVAGWMWTAYIIACVATGIEIVVGVLAVFSRWGSFATTIISGVSSAFTLAASGTATAVFLTLAGGFKAAFDPYNISIHIGGRVLGVTWLAAAFSLASGFFWFLSVCCCSGRSSSPAHSGHKYTAAEKTPYTYERVSSPMLGNHAAPHNPHESIGYQGPSGAYEPYRHS